MCRYAVVVVAFSATLTARKGSSLAGYRLVATLGGYALELYDWLVFLTATPYLNSVFFPYGSTLPTLAVALAGFLARPVGAVVLARFADSAGRRKALLLSVGLMSVGALVIGLCPSYASVGWWASAALVIARVMQGFSTGGEISAATAYLTEAPGRRGLLSSAMYMSAIVGSCLALVAVPGLTWLLGQSAMLAFGWRIPFVLGACAAVGVYLLRRFVDESRDFERAKASGDAFSWAELWEHRKQALRVTGYMLTASVVYYTFSSYLPVYSSSQYGLSAPQTLAASLGAQAVFFVAVAVVGWFTGELADGVAYRCITVSACLVIVLAPALFGYLQLQRNAWGLFVVMALALAVYALGAAPSAAAVSEIFPPTVRTTGLGIPSNTVAAVFGGSAPYLIVWMTEHRLAWLYPLYVSAISALGVTLIFLTRNVKPAARTSPNRAQSAIGN